MKPIELTMRGFISYKNEVTIDFRKLYDSRVFLISGDTGSGKTTIFDAISFALFGQVSRSDVTDKNLRSDFLTGSDPYTYVRLSFEVDKKIYEIERIPKQTAKKSKKNQNINTSVSLFDITDEKKLISDKVKETNERVSKIIGLNKDQLKKVMLLAQGEFADFLKASSTEKKDLLGQIFNTEVYRNIQDKLKERASESDKSLDFLDKRLEDVIKKDEDLSERIDKSLILGHDFEKIDQVISDKEKNLDDQMALIDEDKKGLEEKKDALLAKRADKINENEQIDKYKKLQADLENLLAQESDYRKLKTEIDLAQKTEKLYPYHMELEGICRDIEEKKADISRKQNLLQDESEKNHDLLKEKETIPALEGQIQEINLQIKTDEEKSKKLEEFKEIEKSYLNLLGLSSQIDDYKESLKANRESFDKIVSENNSLIEEVSGLEASLNDKKLSLGELKGKLDSTEKDMQTSRKNEALKAEIEKLSQKLTEKEALLEDLEFDYKKALEGKRKFLIGALIDELNRDGICPVCGSHIDKKIEKETCSDLDPDALRDQLEALRTELKLFENDIANKSASIICDIDPYQILKDDFDDLNLEKIDLESQIDELDKEVQEKNKTKALNKEKLEALTAEYKRLERKIASCNFDEDEFEKIKISYFAKKDDFADLDLGKLEESLVQNRQKAKDLKNQISSINDAYNENEKNIASLEAGIKSDRDQLENLQDKKESKSEDFDRMLRENFSDFDQFRRYLEVFEDLLKREKESQAFYDKLNEVKISLANLEIFKDKEKADIEKFDQEIKDISRDLNDLSDKISQVNFSFINLKNMAKNIGEIKKDYKDNKAQAQILRKLSKIADGSMGAVRGREKLDFESFVLSYYFDKVLSYSNKRLSYLSNGQFQMHRKKDAGDLRSKSGLDIEIFDANTGKMRPVSTLSGGESFLASLSLALGLSDEISAENGGVKIDTLFIDEGFGTLSDEYLQNAIRIIENLSYENKFIGLISHVKELKDSIDTKILIGYDKVEGSSLRIVN
ncbi:MAG: AAA family ATPase [Finegoldia sp.]|nr:AAA family ATPase [Finegoldia sp.]